MQNRTRDIIRSVVAEYFVNDDKKLMQAQIRETADDLNFIKHNNLWFVYDEVENVIYARLAQ